jgi:hypothetical protein
MKSKIIEFLASKLKNNLTYVEPFNATHPGHAAPLSILLPLGMLLFLGMLLHPAYASPPWHAALPAHAVPFWACCCSLGLSSPPVEGLRLDPYASKQ